MQLETLSSPQGRSLVREIYRELRYERRIGGLQALTTTWRVCTTETELIRLSKRDVTIMHPLGVWSGTALWMQEVVNRFLYGPINAFVYAGAALLLVAVGLTRMGMLKQPSIVVVGIALEACLLLALFVVMYFSPPEETEEEDFHPSSAGASDELLRELGEIGRDYAAMAVQLESISATLTELVDQQRQLIDSVRTGVDAAVSAVRPNAELQSSMQDTTSALTSFASSVSLLGERLRTVEQQEVERLVRAELERILSRTIVQSHATTSPTTQD